MTSHGEQTAHYYVPQPSHYPIVLSSGIFLLSRTLGDGIRLHAAALVLAVAAGINEWWCILALGAAMILYTEEGGVIATIWTDSIQMFVYLLGAIVCFTKDGQLRSCGSNEEQRRLCKAQRMYVPPVRSSRTQSAPGGVVVTLASAAAVAVR